MEDLLRTPLYHTLRTNQMGYIKSICTLKPSCQGFMAINPWRLGFNYYITAINQIMGVFIRWNGTMEWNGGMERWNGIVEWNGGIVE